MSAATRLPFIAGSATVAAAVAALMNIPAVRVLLEKLLGQTLAKNMWKIAALGFALLNFKNLPGMWHLRVFRGIAYQIWLQPSTQLPRHLFAPMITSSYNTLYDTDYNLHKSNSTYFADLDIARAHYVGALIRTGLARLNKGDEDDLPAQAKQAKGEYFVALGAVSCFFQKQIEPLQGFDIYTRILSWDRKWIYVVSHIVQKNALKPTKYVLQPWKKSPRRANDANTTDNNEPEDLTKFIFATSVSRYVFKKGRLTINPEIILERSRLLPPRPEGVGYPPRAAELESALSTGAPSTPAANVVGAVSVPPTAARIAEKLGQAADEIVDDGEEEPWAWDDMEKERLRGLEIAGHFDKLNGAHGELRVGEVLGQYGDYW